jgi:hypothetical protein
MRITLLLLLCCLFSINGNAQKLYLGETKLDVANIYATQYPEWVVADLNNPKDSTTILFCAKEKNKESNNAYYRKYIFNAKGICIESISVYNIYNLTVWLAYLNKNFVKAGKLEWVNLDGSIGITLQSDETCFWLNTFLIDNTY